MPSDKALPDRPHPDWYRKAAKRKLVALRRSEAKAKLSDAQRIVAREHGFSSWRKLIAEIDARRAGASSAEFFDAIRRDEYETIRRLLKSHPRLAGARSPAGETPLHVAAEINNAETIQILLSHGADPKARYGLSAHSALSWAVTTMAFEAAEALVRAGVEPDLFCAAGLGRLDAVRSFFDRAGRVKRNASRTGSSRFGPGGERLPCPLNGSREIVSDALYLACRNGQVEVARDLLGRNVDVDYRAFLGGTLLHWAHFGGSREIIEMLESAGADPTLRDHEHAATPRAFGICVPSSWGILRLVYLRLKEDPSLAKVDEARGTPLHEAARAGHEKIVRLLLACGADPASRDREGRTPLDLAREGNHESICTILRAQGAGGEPQPAG